MTNLHNELQALIDEHGVTAVRKELRILAPPKPRKKHTANTDASLSKALNTLLKGVERNEVEVNG